MDSTLGRKPAVSGDIHRYSFPRSDLTVTLDGVSIAPTLALGGWLAFKPDHGSTMVMGDLVLLETEINPVMSKLIEGGLEVTASQSPTPGKSTLPQPSVGGAPSRQNLQDLSMVCYVRGSR